MKRIFFIVIFIFGFIYSSYCNDTLTTKIIIYREKNFYGSAISYKIFANDSLIVKLSNNSYFVYECKPGKYKLMIDMNPNTQVNINAEQGKTSFVRLGLNVGFWSSKPELLLVDSEMANFRITNGNMRKIDKNQLPLKRFKHRVGINLAFGGGFEDFAMFTTTDDENANISFGGGYGFGIKYGYEVNKHFDLALDANYQFSFLRPYLKNATTTFRRGYLSITPSYIIPVSNGDIMRFKIGGGYDFYFDNELSIGGYKVKNGFNETWKYNIASGFHISANLEMNFSKKLSINYGIKYYYVKYSYKSGGIKTWPLEGEAKYNPNGSGLDFSTGIYYHF
ncbi:MAG: DUF2846 domain-containing protein [Bacteroidales bacterium]